VIPLGNRVTDDLAALKRAGTRAAGVPAVKRVAGYRLEEQVGQGGMAVVFLAADERLGRPVALKVLAGSLAADEEFRRRFIRESRAAAVDDRGRRPDGVALARRVWDLWCLVWGILLA
jgi:serine/threonine protein kinase